MSDTIYDAFTRDRHHQSSQAAFGEVLVEKARSRMGKKYSDRSMGPELFDCSGLVIWCVREAGSTMFSGKRPSANDLFRYYTSPVTEENLQLGDLVFTKNYSSTTRNIGDIYKEVGHVGIYIGNREMINAVDDYTNPNTNVTTRGCVKISDLNSSTQRDLFVAYGRIEGEIPHTPSNIGQSRRNIGR